MGDIADAIPERKLIENSQNLATTAALHLDISMAAEGGDSIDRQFPRGINSIRFIALIRHDAPQNSLAQITRLV